MKNQDKTKFNIGDVVYYEVGYYAYNNDCVILPKSQISASKIIGFDFDDNGEIDSYMLAGDRERKVVFSSFEEARAAQKSNKSGAHED